MTRGEIFIYGRLNLGGFCNKVKSEQCFLRQEPFKKLLFSFQRFTKTSLNRARQSQDFNLRRKFSRNIDEKFVWGRKP
jgi:hypothetical protein